MAVSTPTGMLEDPHTLAIESAPTSRSPPRTADVGISIAILDPTRMRDRWGIISPTKPMVPQQLTAMAVHRETTIRHTYLKRVGLIPSATAGPSPAEITSILLDMRRANTASTARLPKRRGILSHTTLYIDPRLHSYTALRSSGSALYFSNIDAAENMYIVAIPMSTIIVGVTLFLMANMEMIMQGTRENTMAFRVSPRSPVKPKMLMSMMKNRDAPNSAPDEIPVV